MFKPKTDPELVSRLDQLERKLEVQLEGMERVRATLSDLELTSARMRELEVEWLDTYEKFRNLYARISKRVQRAGATEEPEKPERPNGVMNPAALALLNQGRHGG